MAAQSTSDLNALAAADSLDLLPIVDTSASETKKITISNLFATPQPIGAITPNTGRFTTLRLTSGSTINEFSTDIFLSGNSNTAVPTERAVRSFVNAKQYQHNYMLGLQGGDTTAIQYYHLDEETYNGLFSDTSLLGLGQDGGTSLQIDYGSNTIVGRVSGTQRFAATSSGFRLATGTYVTSFSIDGTLSGNSDNSVPTEKAVKTYVDENAGGKFSEIIKPTSGTLTESECNGNHINNKGQITENIQALPSCVEGLSATIIASSDTTGGLYVKADASDKIYLDGIALNDGDKAGMMNPTVGNSFRIFSFESSDGEYDWLLESGPNTTVVDGGP